jgi:hypothetical protein
MIVYPIWVVEVNNEIIAAYKHEAEAIRARDRLSWGGNIKVIVYTIIYYEESEQ